jgi:preprotein translocase subunit SecA
MGALAPSPAPMPTEFETQKPVKVEKTPGRNEPCYCGSGKKYKLCHGR